MAAERVLVDTGPLVAILSQSDQYHDVCAQESRQLADAALMYLAQRERISTIFTIDRRDFLVSRLSDNRHPILLPSLEADS